MYHRFRTNLQPEQGVCVSLFRRTDVWALAYEGAETLPQGSHEIQLPFHQRIIFTKSTSI